MNRWQLLTERAAQTRAGGWFFVHVANRIDPPLLRASRGRLSLALGQPVLLLEHRGARTGEPRATPLLYARDGDAVLLVASNAGSLRHPAWYHNVRANPQVRLILSGASGPYTAREASEQERGRLWEIVCDLYAGYEVYQGRAGERQIPIIVCERGASAK